MFLDPLDMPVHVYLVPSGLDTTPSFRSVGAQAKVVLALLRNRDTDAVGSILQDLDGAASMMTKL